VADKHEHPQCLDLDAVIEYCTNGCGNYNAKTCIETAGEVQAGFKGTKVQG